MLLIRRNWKGQKFKLIYAVIASFIIRNICSVIAGYETYKVFFKHEPSDMNVLIMVITSGGVYCFDNLSYIFMAEKYQVISTRIPAVFQEKEVEDRTACR
jgi:TctA family transporter